MATRGVSVGLVKSQGTVASLLKHDLSEEEIGISDLHQVGVLAASVQKFTVAYCTQGRRAS